MDDISNRTLAIVLIAAILISFGGTLFGMSRLTAMTGVRAPKVFTPLINAMTTITATVNLSVFELTELNWTPKGLNWSEGQVDSGTAGCTIDSDGNDGSVAVGATANNCTGSRAFTSVTGGLNMTNVGNTNLSVNLSTSTTPSIFIGGTGAVAKWNISDALGVGTAGEDTCSVAYNDGARAWTSFTTTQTTVCNGTDKLRPTAGNNTLMVHFTFVIPQDTPTGGKNATVTATYIKNTESFN